MFTKNMGHIWLPFRKYVLEKVIHINFLDHFVYKLCCAEKRTCSPLLNLLSFKVGQAGLEAAFQVPMPEDSVSSPDASSISQVLLDLGDFHSNPSGLL